MNVGQVVAVSNIWTDCVTGFFVIGVTLYPVVGDVLDGRHTKDATGFQYVRLIAAGFRDRSI